MMENKKIPVIFDSDIGADIDDTWALCHLLRSPELELIYAVSAEGDTTYKAALMAKILDKAGHGDVPVGVGIESGPDQYQQKEWLGSYTLDDYPGKVYADGVDGIIKAVREADGVVTYIVIGPMLNIGKAIEKAPDIAEKIKIVGTLGSIYRSFEPDSICPEYNIRCHTKESQAAVTAVKDVFLVSLDSTFDLCLDGERYQRLLAKRETDKYMKIIMDNFDVWMVAMNSTYYKTQSTILFDCAAVYGAYADEWLDTVELPIYLDDEGYTRIDPEKGKPMKCTKGWKDREAFYDHLTARLLGEE